MYLLLRRECRATSKFEWLVSINGFAVLCQASASASKLRSSQGLLPISEADPALNQPLSILQAGEAMQCVCLPSSRRSNERR